MTSGRIIYIHGRGFGATYSTKWMDGLVTGLERAGYDMPRQEIETLTISVSYSAFLDPAVHIRDGDRSTLQAPGQTATSISAFQERQKTLRRRIGAGFREETTDKLVRQAASNDRIAEQVIGQRFRDVKRYVNHESRRERILNHIAEQLPETGTVVLIGHSLGSIIALDLVRRWPKGLRLDLLLTLGSPAALGPMQRHLKGLVNELPRDLLGGWVNMYDPSDPVTGGSGLRPHFDDDVVDHRVQNGGVRGNHGADRHLEQVTAGVVIGPHVASYLDCEYPGFSIPQDTTVAAAMFDAALGCWMRHELMARQPRRSTPRAQRLLACEILRAKAARAFELDPAEDLRKHIVPLEEALRPHLEDEKLLKLQLQLRSAALFAPFALEIERDHVFATLMKLAEEVGWDTGRVQKVDRGMEEARSSQKAQQNLTGAVVLGGAALAVAGLLTGGFALAAAPGMAGAAFITSGLAGLGGLAGGGMTAGLFITAGAGAASSLLAKNALGMMSALQTREEIIKIHAEVLVHRWEGRGDAASQLVRELRQLRDAARKESRLHGAIDQDGPKGSLAKDWVEKKRILDLSIKALS